MQPLSDGDPVQIGPYRLRGRLGAGGMGQVFLASTPAGRLIALKVVRPELSGDQEFRERFRQEIAAARQVRGLYTAELVDADPDADPPWLATAYVPGSSLQQVLDSRGPLPEAEAFRLVAGVAEALQAIHAVGVVHRDLKPSNVVLGPDGPRVIDFGIARALEGATLTRTGMSVGTPQFMAPEQLLDLPVTPMIDVFALGSLAACAVLGRSPFGGGQPAAVHYRVLHEPPNLNGCPPRLRALIESCLAKQPADRPQPAEILQYCLQHADMTAGLVPAPARYPATEIAADRRMAPPPTLIAGVAPQSPPAGTPSRLAPPPPVVKAVRLIYAGAQITAGGVVVAAVPLTRTELQTHGAVSGATITGTVFTGLVSVGLWLWMAKRVKRGWGKATAAAIVLFAVKCLFLLKAVSAFYGDVGSSSHDLSFLFELAEWGVGLFAMLALRDQRSSAYFAALNRARSLAAPEWPKRTTAPTGGPRHGKT
jgi:hypothetical protein